MQVLVTGGSGFIGRYACAQLLAAGHTVTVLDLVAPPAAAARERVIVGDVRDPAALRTAMRGADAVLHLAAAHHDFGIARDTYFAVNEGSTALICDIMDEQGVTDLCFFSSVAVFGRAAPPVRDDSAPDPISYYGQSKLAGEHKVRAWAERGGARRALVIRPSVTFGPHNYANMYSLIRQIASGFFLPVGEGGNVKSMTYVENLVDATLYLWRHDRHEPFLAVNCVDKPDLTSREIVHHVHGALGTRPPAFHVPLGAALALATPFDFVIRLTGRNLPISSARIRKLAGDETRFEADRLAESGFRARVPISEGIRRMVEWFLREGRHETPVWRLPPAEVTTFVTAVDTVDA
jgi:nucleoside-diphosphate-sugar epimerase